MSLFARRLVQLVRQANRIAWVVLAFFIAFTAWGVHELRERESHLAQERFELQVEEVVDAIRARMTAHEQILIGGAALFDASDEVDRDEWRRYVERLRLQQYYPGIQALAYTQVIRPEQLDAHIQTLRQEFPDYEVRPQGERSLYTSIIYIEPFRDRNLAAFGYDMFSEPVRRQAMTAAVDENDTRISGRVTLMQENRGKVQPGFLMYLPVYRKDLSTATPEQRWAALEGFVYSPYRIEDLMDGILGQRNLNLHFAIYAGPANDEVNRLFPASPPQLQLWRGFASQRQLALYGQLWTLDFVSDPEAFPGYWQRLEQAVIALGLSTGLLLFLLISFLANESRRARSLARGMTRDIRQTLDALRLSEERFRLALDSSAMGTWNWYLADNNIHWDDTMHQLFGLSHDQFLSSYESFLALLHPEDRQRVFGEVAHALEAQLPFDSEYRVIWPDGTLHHIAARARVLMDDKQQPSLMTGTCWDITDKKRLEKMKSEFVATVSHELRTPLSSISSALALLTQGSEKLDAAQQQKLLEVADKNTERLKHLIDDLLDMEKLAQARMQYDFHVCALAPLVQRALDENRFYAEQHAVSFRMDTGLVVAEVRLDPARFLQIMANLLSNAAKFSEPGTEVVVSLSLNAPGWVRVAVTDQGIGIDEKDQPYIFDKFFQVDASDQRRKGGTGLGLAIARAMAEQMQGRLGFTSSAGNGSCFFVDFPLFMDFLEAEDVTNRAKGSPDFSAPTPQPIHD